MKIYPFGEYSILKSDMYKQYVNFFFYLKEILQNGKSIFMSWNLGLANNFFTTYSYYLNSPLNLGVIFFNNTNMDVFIEILLCIKLILITNFTIIFFEKSYNYKKIEVVLFGLIYAFSSYVICYSFHIMWLDCVYMLPLVLLFINEYTKSGKIWPFIIALTYSILTNYYIGYMVAFFAGIYYVFVFFPQSPKKFLKFLVAMAVSFAIGMIVIFPSMKQLSGKMNFSTEIIKINIENIRLFINTIFNNYIYMFSQKTGLIFSSTLIMVLLPMYYFNKNISKREKVGFSAIIIFLMLPIISPFLNKLWHGFTEPNCFNFRYSFTLIFTLIIMAFREFQNIRVTKNWYFAASFCIWGILLAIEIIFNKLGYLQSDGYNVTNISILISAIIYLIMIGLIYAYRKSNKYKKIVTIVLFIIVIVDLIIAAKSGQNNNDKYFKRETFLQYNSFFEYFHKKYYLSETDRIIFMPDEYGSNMSLRYNYSNIGFFSSARNRKALKAMEKLGYNVQRHEQLWITSYSGTFINYSIAGVKYYITRDFIEDNEIYGFYLIDVYKDEKNTFYIYENKNNFDIGFFAKNNIEDSYNPFKMQNDLLNGLISENKEEDYFEDIEKSDILHCEKTIEYENEMQILKYKVRAIRDCSIYIFSEYSLELDINGESKFESYSSLWSTESGIKQIVHLKEDEEFEFEIKTSQNLELLYVFVSDNEKIQKILEQKDKFFSVKEIGKNSLKGVTDFNDEGFLVFSISYDENWKAYVDGAEVKIQDFAGAFLGIELKRGQHFIEIEYNK